MLGSVNIIISSGVRSSSGDMFFSCLVPARFAPALCLVGLAHRGRRAAFKQYRRPRQRAKIRVASPWKAKSPARCAGFRRSPLAAFTAAWAFLRRAQRSDKLGRNIYRQRRPDEGAELRVGDRRRRRRPRQGCRGLKPEKIKLRRRAAAGAGTNAKLSRAPRSGKPPPAIAASGGRRSVA